MHTDARKSHCSPPFNQAEKIILFILRFVGISACFAGFAVFLPHAWMNSAHDWLGLGTLPEAPIVSYLTRSLSLLYFIFALFTLGIAGNLRQYKPLVGIWGQAAGIAGIVLFGIDWHAGMPYAWTFTEGPPGIIIGATIYTLHHRIGPSIQEPSPFRETRLSRETLPGE